MSIPKFSIKHPVLVVAVAIMIMVVGLICMSRIGVDLMPPMNPGIITVTTSYPGSNPEEIERLISKPIEEQINKVAGINTLSSRNIEGTSIITVEFTMETDILNAETLVREKVSIARKNLPDDLTTDPVLSRVDPSDSPVMKLAIMADLPPAELYDVVNEQIKPILEKVSGVGEVRIVGGTRREIQIELDRNKLNLYNMSASSIAGQLKQTGGNVSVGRYDRNDNTVLFRTLGNFENFHQIENSVISFSGDVSNAITLKSVGTVRDGLEDEVTRAYIYYPENSSAQAVRVQKTCILLDIYKQSGSNSVAIVNKINKDMKNVNQVLAGIKGNPRLVYVYDTAKDIQDNISDVRSTLFLAILFAIIVVYLFLGNFRSTLITSIAIPVSLIGSFGLMYVAGFTMNVMTLMALSLCIGLLVDDAIVVQENVFRKLEDGASPAEAAEKGTSEVSLAIIATTLTVISVFTPIAFTTGITGSFFKEFGITVAFAVAISLFVALTMSPLMNAYFMKTAKRNNNIVVRIFERFQDWLDRVYAKVIAFALRRPKIIILGTVGILIISLLAFGATKKTFFNESESGNLSISLELPTKTSLDGTQKITMEIVVQIKEKVKADINYMTIQVGTENKEYNDATIGVFLTGSKKRSRSIGAIKNDIREILKKYPSANPTLGDYDNAAMSGSRSFSLDLRGDNLDELKVYSEKLMERLKKVSDLTELTSTYQEGKPEFQIKLDTEKMQMLGVSPKLAGTELRNHVEGTTVGKFYANGLDYDVRMRLKPEQRDIQRTYNEMKVPNIGTSMIPLNLISTAETKIGMSQIRRQDRARLIQISGNIASGGAVGSAVEKTRNIIKNEIKLPAGIHYSFAGEGDYYGDMISNVVMAMGLSVVAIYLVLACLYGSFITPFTILLALPFALSGAFIAFFVTGTNVDVIGLIGIITLMGMVTKNSILLVDFALEGVRSGMDRNEAIARAGKLRLRPIIMTSLAILVGALPLALGVGEAARFRKGMGIAIVGGILISTLITLIVVPAVFGFIDKLRVKLESGFQIGTETNEQKHKKTR